MGTLFRLLGLAAWWYQAAPAPQAPAVPTATVQDLSHFSEVMGGNLKYQVLLPPAYGKSAKRYPVLYWFHGYEKADPRRDAEVAAYVAAHDLIIVNLGPVETVGAYPLYFPELADHVDKSLRTIADRDHRGVSGFSMGGYMAFWTAGKYPDLLSSASSFMGMPEASVGPKDLDLENNLDDLYANFDGVRTRLVTGTRDFVQYYHRRMASIWMYTRVGHESENFDAENGTPEIAKTLDFHMHAFGLPMPKPALFNHADPYPNFRVWGWEVASERTQPGFTVLENVSSKGFRSAVREWVPGGSTIPSAKLSVASAPVYVPGSPHPVTYLRLRDGNLRRTVQKADARGRLNFELDGEAYEVGISAEGLIAVGGAEVSDAAWATAGKPVKLKVKFYNKGAAPSAAATILWESSNPLVKIDVPSSKLYPLLPGESAMLPVTFTVADESRAMVRIFAVEGTNRTPIDVPLFPPAEPTLDFQISDGRSLTIYQHANKLVMTTLGEGNRDGHAAPGESFVVLLPDGEGMRAAELFTNDVCVDNHLRGFDSWNEYDHAGTSARYSVPTFRKECQPGHVVHVLARILIPNAPNHQVRYAALDIPVWYRPGEEPK